VHLIEVDPVGAEPAEYMSAVSTKLIPWWSAAWMMRTQSSWSGLPTAPNIIVPRHWALTWMPVRPRVRYRMVLLAVVRRSSSRTLGAGVDSRSIPED
jgi:hypothetical protein